jgi:hypothetical protein
MKRALAIWLAASGSAQSALEARVVATLGSDALANSPLAVMHAADLDGDGRAELATIDEAGATIAWQLDGTTLRARARLTLAEPQHCLVAFADVDGKPGAELLALSRAGAFAHALGSEGFAAPMALLPRTRLTLRTGKPQLSSFARDLNGDQRVDLVVPERTQSALWVRGAGEGLTFTRALTLPTNASIEHTATGNGLQSTLASSVRIPALDVVDLDGDGRLDLRTSADERFAYRLQGADASFGALQELDLKLFRDTTPRADLQLGGTATVSDQTRLETRDLDGDARPDYVITHRRKLWVFLANAQGPQFTQAQDIKAVAEDITLPLLLDLDQDARPDLLLIRLQVPSEATLALGLVKSFDVDVHALGYRNERGANAAADARVFAATPAWRRTVTLRVPPLLSLMERQDELLGRVLAIVDQARLVARGEVDGDAPADLVRIGGDGAALELWRGVGNPDPLVARARIEQRVAELLFTEPDTVFDIDRGLRVLDSWVAGTLAAGTDAKPAATLALRPREQFELLELALADLDGDGRAEALLTYRAIGKGQARSVEIVGFGR